MSKFADRLDGLMERATKGPWLARPEYGCRNPEHWEVAPYRVCKVGVPAEIARVWNYEEKDQPNAELIAYLVNHAPAIRDLVRAAEKISVKLIDGSNMQISVDDLMELKACSAKLEEE